MLLINLIITFFTALATLIVGAIVKAGLDIAVIANKPRDEQAT